MVNYLVAVDQSSCSQKAFRTTLERVNHVKDDLVIVSVAGDKHLLSLTDMPAVMYINIQETEKKRVKLLLRQYEKLAQKKMIRFNLVLGVGYNVGEMICQIAEKKKSDVIILGRRGMSSFKRALLGSTSNYVVEHAQCDVLVTKGENLEELPPNEEEESELVFERKIEEISLQY